MTKIPFGLFFAVHDRSSENQCWVDFSDLGIELDSLREFIAAIEKDFGANSICKASDAERVKILVGTVLGGMVSDLILIGRTMDD